MQHVAALAGVSLKTVSRVVNEEPGVSDELVERVQQAVSRLDYRHNLAASNLRRGRRTSSIGVLVQDLGNDFCGELLRAVEGRARSRGVVVMSSSLDEERDREHQLVASLVERRIDGLILMPASTNQDYLLPEVRAGLAVVVVDRWPGTPSLDSVTADNRGGAAAAVAHLAGHGHRRIALIGDSPAIPTAAERVEGYRAGLRDAGLTVDPALERTGVRSSADAEAAALELLAAPGAPTAVFAARNVITEGVVRALRRLGRAHETALVGFDDFATADLLDPGVTTIAQAVVDEGERAIDLLLARLDGDDGPVRHEVVATTLVPRGSGEIAAAWT